MIKQKLGVHNEWSQRLRGGAACLSLILVLSLLSGCVSPNAPVQIKRFSDAVATTETNATAAFDLVESAYFEEQVTRIALDTNALEFNPASIKPFLRPEDIQARLNVLDVLKLYAAKLSLLVGNTSGTNLDQETTKLGNALNKLDTNLVSSALLQKEPLTSQEINIFTAAFNAVMHWIISRQEEKQAADVIRSMRQPVTDICQFLEKDLSILRPQLSATYKMTRQNDNLAMNASWPRLTPGQRREEIQNLMDLTFAMNHADSTLATLQSSITNLALAHASLDQVFTKNNADAVSLIEQFSSEAQGITTYYNSLQANK
jgi:hypothetical protein